MFAVYRFGGEKLRREAVNEVRVYFAVSIRTLIYSMELEIGNFHGYGC